MLHTALDTIQMAGGIAPPGADKINLIAEWSKWIAGVALVVAVVIAGVLIGFSGHGRGGGEHGKALLSALAGSLVVASAAGLVAAMGL